MNLGHLCYYRYYSNRCYTNGFLALAKTIVGSENEFETNIKTISLLTMYLFPFIYMLLQNRAVTLNPMRTKARVRDFLAMSNLKVSECRAKKKTFISGLSKHQTEYLLGVQSWCKRNIAGISQTLGILGQ